MKKKIHLGDFDKAVKKDIALRPNCYKNVAIMLQLHDIFIDGCAEKQ